MLFIPNVREQLQTATVATRSSSEREHFYAFHCRSRLSRKKKKNGCSIKLLLLHEQTTTRSSNA